MPLWFAKKGGWQNPAAPDRFARFCERATKHLGDLVDFASTFDEPDVPQLLNWINLPAMEGKSLTEMFNQGLGNARTQLSAPDFAGFFLGDSKKIRDGVLAAHANGKVAMKSARPSMPVGFNLGVPIYVTENGIATDNDARRIEYYQRALAGLKRAIDDGVNVRGYITWSLIDNFEWMSGFEPKFGIVAVDRSTQRRTIKPSATYLGNIARNNSL